MCCCPFAIHICGTKFLIWLHYWSCFQHSDKSGYCFLHIQFYKLLWLWSYVDLFLNLGFYYNAVEYRHKYLNMQHISIKNPCFIVYTTASPKEPPSVTSELRVSVQPAKPTSPIKLSGKELPKLNVFSAHTIFTIYCASFSSRLSYFKIPLAMP